MPLIQDVASPRTEYKCSRLRGARRAPTVCQYCAVGCSQLAFFKDDTLINIEGDPRSPVNEGRQCPKGATIYALNDNPYRVTKPLYRAPGANKWQEVDTAWILDEIAKRIWESRERGFREKAANGIQANAVTNIGFVGGSANDNEECYLFRKLMTGGLGILPVENTARYCHSTTVAALAPTFGYGACTNPPRDLLNSDCIIIMGSNMAEAHPVAFHWPVQASKKGAALCHIDPRFTRTSAVCDHHIPIRPATDIAFILAVVRHILERDLWFHEYVLNYTNAATLINPKFSFNQETGLFSGWNESQNAYSEDLDSWEYQYELDAGGKPARPRTDPTLQDEHCVFQILKRQVEKYTPEAAAEICGCRPVDIIKVAELMAQNSGREKTTAFCYATGFTQHASGAQIIRAIAILQLLLGNIGRPGGGILALRGHSNVQGATDIPTLFNALPNYLPMPHAVEAHATLARYLENGHGYEAARDKKRGMWQLEASRGSWADLPNYMVSLLKAWYGKAAVRENEFGYQWLPKLSGDESFTVTIERMLRGEVEGLMAVGQNIAVTNPNTGMARAAVRNLKWMVVCDLFENETASCWYADPTAPDAVENCRTEVFLLPAATSLECAGSVTNTERLMQWHKPGRAAPGEAQSAGWWIYELGKRFKKFAAESGRSRDAGLLALTWDYDAKTATVNRARAQSPEPKNEFGAEPAGSDAKNGQTAKSGAEKSDITDIDMDKVALEMNGYHVDSAKPCAGAHTLAADGSTACGCRLLSGFLDGSGANLMQRDDAAPVEHALSPDYRYAWPMNVRILYNRCSADPAGRPWSERKKLVWWDEIDKCWKGYDKPHFDTLKSPAYRPPEGATGTAALGGDDPFSAHTDGKAWLFVPYGLKDGPLPVHYEPVESPCRNLLFSCQHTPGVIIIDDPRNPIAKTASPEYPTAMTTYHMVEHWLSGAMTRHVPWLCALQPECFLEIAPEMAEACGIAPGSWISVKSARADLQMRALVTPRLRQGMVLGKRIAVVGSFVNSGYKGVVCDPVTNDLSPALMSPEGLIPASKGFAVHVSPGESDKAEKFHCEAVMYPRAMREDIPSTPWAAQPEGRSYK